ncbi:unnamed protein product, partial [Iphiclides podalirius]
MKAQSPPRGRPRGGILQWRRDRVGVRAFRVSPKPRHTALGLDILHVHRPKKNVLSNVCCADSQKESRVGLILFDIAKAAEYTLRSLWVLQEYSSSNFSFFLVKD